VRFERACARGVRWVLEVAQSPATSAGCCSLAFAASRLPFVVTDMRPHGNPTERRSDRCRTSRPPPPLHLTSGAPGAEPDPPSGGSFLPWDSPSPGFPSSDVPAGVHSTPFPGLGSWGHHDIVFRPRGFAPPRRLPPHRGFQACCSLVPDLGFAGFRLDPGVTSEEARPFARFPPALYPSKVSPRRQLHLITEAAPLLPFVPDAVASDRFSPHRALPRGSAR
jgi:hypothetical protein